jgi:PKD repeat protein
MIIVKKLISKIAMSIFLVASFAGKAQDAQPAVKNPGSIDYFKNNNSLRLNAIAREQDNAWAEHQNTVREFARQRKLEVRKELPNGRVEELVRVENGFPWYYTTNNSGAAVTTRADHIQAGGRLGLNLSGAAAPPIGVWDAGAVLKDHQEFINTGTSRVTQKDNATTVSTHATHVSGTLIAGGVVSKSKGMAFNGSLHAYDWSNDNSEMAAAAAGGMLISSHSYGYTYGWSGDKWYGNPTISKVEDYRFGFYSSYTRAWDDIAFNAPHYLIVKSAGNDRGNKGPEGSEYPPDGGDDGFDTIGTDAVGKNILTVGAVSQVSNYTKPSDVNMYSSSSWGPADDGRIKPDVVGKGVLVYSASGTGPTTYATMNGTSMATPNVAGTLALLQEYYIQLNGTPMRAATLKALTIHTADEAGPAAGPDYMFGWGLVNGERAAMLIGQNKVNDKTIQELRLSSGQTYTLSVTSDGTTPLKATITWTDPAGNALAPSLDPATRALVNDLDLSISGNSTTYYPWKLDRNNPSAAATRNSKNFVDNVEVVLIESPKAGTYSIRVTHDGSLSSSQNFSLIVSGTSQTSAVTPVADFSAAKTTVFAGESVQFTNKSTNNPTSYSWEFEGTETKNSTATNPLVKYNSAGKYAVKLTASNSAGSNTKTVAGYITVEPVPLTAAFTADKTSLTEGESVTFKDQTTGNPVSWSWIISGAIPSTSNLQNPKVTYPKAGSYSVTLKVTNANGTDEMVKSGFINVAMKPPVAGFTVNKTEIFTGESVQFTNQSQNAQSYVWTLTGGTPSSSTLTNPSVKYNTAGTYSVSLKATNETGSDTHTKTSLITVKPAPVKAAFTASVTTVTEGMSVTFTDLSANNPTSWVWAFDGGTPSTSTAKNPKVTYNNPGIYNVTLKVANEYSNDQLTQTGYITVTRKSPVAKFVASATEIPAGGSVQFTNQSENGQTYNWSFAGGSPASSTQKDPVVRYEKAGTYQVSLTATNESGSHTEIKTNHIIVKALPVAAFSADKTEITTGKSITFNNQSQHAVTYNWTFTGGTPGKSNEKNPVITYPTAGTYTVSLTATNEYGSDVVTQTSFITVKMLPVAGFTVNVSEIIEGATVQFTNLSENAAGFVWSFEGGSPASSTQANPAIVYHKAGTYSVSLKAFNEAGTDTRNETAMITVKPVPVVADFTASAIKIEEGEEIIFTDRSMNNPTSWEWIFPGGSPASSTEQNPVVIYMQSGIYDVILKVANSNGSDEIVSTAHVEVTPKNQLPGSKSEAQTDLTTSIGQTFSAPEIVAYPNPVRDNLFVRVENWKGPFDVRMTDLSGRVVYTKSFYSESIRIDVTGLNKGLYILTVTDGISVNSQRVTVH